MIQPPYLKAGDKIAITCPAKTLRAPLTQTIDLLQSWGLEVVLGETVDASFHQFSGTDELRAKDMQGFINNPEIKAIITARGGYGCLRIVDAIDFTPLLTQPKWLIGFSDITVFHMQLQSMGIQSIHGQMPSTIPDSTDKGLESLRKALFGESVQYDFSGSVNNIPGYAEGILVGGNLSLLVALLNSTSDIDYTNKILFIEDIGEYLYAIDRLIRTLDRAGKLAKLLGLVVGGFTDLKDNEIPFGFTAEEIIYEVVKKYDYPVAFNFPAGHVKDNCALVMGAKIKMSANTEKGSLNIN